MRLHGEPDREIHHLLAALTLDAVRTQRQLDRYAETEIVRYVRQTESLGWPWRDILPTPRRMVVRHWEITTRVALAVEHGVGVKVKAVPLNLGYFARYERESSTVSAVEIHVEQTPLGASSPREPARP